jgi:type II secretory pathway pseudopilin PulG
MTAPRSRRSGGFTYLSLIVLIAIIGMVSATAVKLGSVVHRSKSELALLDIGAAFSDALQSYADATPPGQPPQPPSLKELLKDPRFSQTRRHLRKLFVDPMTGKAEWGVVYLGDKVGVLAVYSLSDAKPVKIGNFSQRYSGFAGKEHISDWKFAATGKSSQAAPATVFVPKTTTLDAPLQNVSPAPALTPIVPPPAEPAPPPNSPSPSDEAPPPVPEAPVEAPEVVPEKQESH